MVPPRPVSVVNSSFVSRRLVGTASSRRAVKRSMRAFCFVVLALAPRCIHAVSTRNRFSRREFARDSCSICSAFSAT